MDLWRISKFHTLDGEGGRLAPGRWNSIGHPVVYLAASPAGALLEVLVHLELDEYEPPPPYTLLQVTIPASIRSIVLRVPSGDSWKTDESITRKLGDAWLESSRSVLACVPSAILPKTSNYLLNPLHSDASKLKITEIRTGTYDRRLLHKPVRP